MKLKKVLWKLAIPTVAIGTLFAVTACSTPTQDDNNNNQGQSALQNALNSNNTVLTLNLKTNATQPTTDADLVDSDGTKLKNLYDLSPTSSENALENQTLTVAITGVVAKETNKSVTISYTISAGDATSSTKTLDFVYNVSTADIMAELNKETGNPTWEFVNPSNRPANSTAIIGTDGTKFNSFYQGKFTPTSSLLSGRTITVNVTSVSANSPASNNVAVIKYTLSYQGTTSTERTQVFNINPVQVAGFDSVITNSTTRATDSVNILTPGAEQEQAQKDQINKLLFEERFDKITVADLQFDFDRVLKDFYEAYEIETSNTEIELKNIKVMSITGSGANRSASIEVEYEMESENSNGDETEQTLKKTINWNIRPTFINSGEIDSIRQTLNNASTNANSNIDFSDLKEVFLGEKDDDGEQDQDDIGIFDQIAAINRQNGTNVDGQGALIGYEMTLDDIFSQLTTNPTRALVVNKDTVFKVPSLHFNTYLQPNTPPMQDGGYNVMDQNTAQMNTAKIARIEAKVLNAANGVYVVNDNQEIRDILGIATGTTLDAGLTEINVSKPTTPNDKALNDTLIFKVIYGTTRTDIFSISYPPLADNVLRKEQLNQLVSTLDAATLSQIFTLKDQTNAPTMNTQLTGTDSTKFATFYNINTYNSGITSLGQITFNLTSVENAVNDANKVKLNFTLNVTSGATTITSDPQSLEFQFKAPADNSALQAKLDNAQLLFTAKDGVTLPTMDAQLVDTNGTLLKNFYDLSVTKASDLPTGFVINITSVVARPGHVNEKINITYTISANDVTSSPKTFNFAYNPVATTPNPSTWQAIVDGLNTAPSITLKNGQTKPTDNTGLTLDSFKTLYDLDLHVDQTSQDGPAFISGHKITVNLTGVSAVVNSTTQVTLTYTITSNLVTSTAKTVTFDVVSGMIVIS